jgi:UDP-N-acetylmuramyl pentapeptide synthase
MKITLKGLAQVIGGEIRQGNPDLMLNGISTDSRSISKGNVFLRLREKNLTGTNL